MLGAIRSHKRLTRWILSMVVAGLAISIVSMYALSTYQPLSSQGGSQTVETAGSENQLLDQLKSSIEQHRDETAAEPESVSAWLNLAEDQYNLGMVYLQNQDTVNAQNYFDQSYQSYVKLKDLEPTNSDIRAKLAVSAQLAGHAESAREYFKQTLQMAPDNLTARFYYGILLMETDKNVPAAVEQWRKVEELNPESIYADQARQLIAAAQAGPENKD